MGTINEELASLMHRLERERDELRLKLQLGKAEVRDEWEKLETQWRQLRGKTEKVKDVVDETAKRIEDAAVSAAREIQRGYERIRKMR